MIQRIQTVFLMIAAVALGTQVATPLVKSSVTDTAYYRDSLLYLKEYMPTLVLLIVTIALVLITIFLFKNRKLQKALVLAGIVGILATNLVVGATFLAPTQSIMNISNATITPGIGAFMPVIAMISLIFAYRGITKDDKIVKSMDRLR